MVEFQGERDEFGTGVEQGFRMHAPIVPSRPFPMNDKDLPPLAETPPGRYRHYKVMLYDVLGTVRHSETLEPMTLYRALYGDHRLGYAQMGHMLADIIQRAAGANRHGDASGLHRRNRILHPRRDGAVTK